MKKIAAPLPSFPYRRKSKLKSFSTLYSRTFQLLNFCLYGNDDSRAACFPNGRLSLAYCTRPSKNENIIYSLFSNGISRWGGLAAHPAVTRISGLQSPQTPNLQGPCSSRSDGFLPSLRCSRTCALQPVVREITNSGVNIAVGTPNF
ncbi:Uncharacterised protein [Neisseria meningitidis]|nr:Uncharacterised protein [Neisseria meningitidis]CWQ67465.1 Uncharacterised protein [Neisseria meningitidis]